MNGKDSGVTRDNQLSLEKYEHGLIEKQAELNLEKIIKQESEDELIAELEKKNVKVNKKDIRFVARDSTGQIVWLENGNKTAGLEHIVSRHAADFKSKFGVENDKIDDFLREVISKGKVISNKTKYIKGRKSYERVYKYQESTLIMTGIGGNGFLVSAYPVSLKGDKK